MARKQKMNMQDENGVAKATEPALGETVTVAEQPKIDFQSWFALRSKSIPAQHHEEIIKADFKARKVPGMATVADFDNALKKYGIKLG